MSSLKPCPTMRLKLLTMGESRVGKSSLLKAYMQLADEENENNKPGNVDSDPTIGVDFVAFPQDTERTLSNGTVVRVVTSVFDLSGDIQFLKIRNEFYADFHGAMLVFDVNRRTTFDKIDTWIKEYRTFNGKSRKPLRGVLLGNKADRTAAGPRNQNRQVSSKEATLYAKRHGLRYFEVSAKTGRGVIEAVAACLNASEGPVMRTSTFFQSAPKREKGATANESYFQRPTSPGDAPRQPSQNMKPRPTQAPPSAARTHPQERKSGAMFEHQVDLSVLSVEKIQTMGVKDMKAALRVLKVSYHTMFEKSELRKALEQAWTRWKAERQSEMDEVERKRIVAGVEQWALSLRQSIILMLNDVHNAHDTSHKLYLHPRKSNLQQITKSYRKALPSIHPDKAASRSSDWRVQAKATEMFKVINAAFEKYKQRFGK